MVTPACLLPGVHAGFVLLKGAGLLLKIWLLRAERWLSGCGQLRVGVRLSYLFYLDTNNNRREPLLIIHKIRLGFEPLTCRSKASCPFQSLRIKSIVVLELQVQPGFQRLLAFEAKYAASECLLLVALWLFTLYFHFVRLTKWDGKQQVTQLVMGQSQDPSSFNFPNCCGLGKALPNGRSAQETISCSLSWRSSHEIQITDPSHPLLTCFLCSSYI